MTSGSTARVYCMTYCPLNQVKRKFVTYFVTHSLFEGSNRVHVGGGTWKHPLYKQCNLQAHAAWTMAMAHAWQTNTWLAQNRSYRELPVSHWSVTAHCTGGESLPTLHTFFSSLSFLWQQGRCPTGCPFTANRLTPASQTAGA